MRLRLASASAVLLGLTVPAPAQAQVLADGHVDYAARIVDGQLRGQIKDGTRGAAVWRDVAGVTFAVTDGARTTVPASAAYLGPAGSTVWMLPQTQRAGLLWPGWNTEELTSADVDGPVTWRLDAVDGPGAVTVHQTGVFGDPDFVFRSADGLPDARAIPLGTHAHGNWVFSREGHYRLTFTLAARLRSDSAAQDTQTLAVTVGAPAPTPTPTPGANPTPTPQPPDAPPASPQPPVTAPRLRALSARVDGRALRLRVRLDRRSRVTTTLRRGTKTAATTKARTVPAGTRTLRLRLSRRPATGRHTVRVTATADGRSRTRAIAVRVRGR